MNKIVHQFVDDIVNNAPTGDKESVIKYACDKYSFTLDRKVYYCRYFAVRFSYSQSGAFSNTVLSLSALQKYDKIPFFVVLVRKGAPNIIYLANSTFLSKISQSSKELTMCNIKGSFNGSDIIKEYKGLKNAPDNFDELFALHEGLDWEDNLSRLVVATSAIKPNSQKFSADAAALQNIFDSVSRAQSFVQSENFQILNDDLNERCNKCRDAILVASHIENVNLRGRLIEFLITTDDELRNRISSILRDREQLLPEFSTDDDLGDYIRVFDNCKIYTDIKTKILYLDSAPKAYNVDKFLEKMAESDASFFFFIIGIDEHGVVNTALCSVYHNDLIDASVVQHHCAGRATRGVVQLNGKVLNKILNEESFVNKIDSEKATQYLKDLLAR
jgi:hypothetical protein